MKTSGESGAPSRTHAEASPEFPRPSSHRAASSSHDSPVEAASSNHGTTNASTSLSTGIPDLISTTLSLVSAVCVSTKEADPAALKAPWPASVCDRRRPAP